MGTSLWLLCGSFFLIFLGAGAFQQFISPYLLKTHHLGADASSAVLATVYLAAFVCLTFASYSMAWLGEYAALGLGALAYALFGVAALISGNLLVLLLAAVVWGWGSSVLWTAGSTFVLDLAEEGSCGRYTGMLYTGVIIGQALGVLLLSGMVDLLGPRGMVACVVVITLLGTAIALFLPRRRQRRAAEAAKPLQRVVRSWHAHSITYAAALVFGVRPPSWRLLTNCIGPVRLGGGRLDHSRFLRSAHSCEQRWWLAD